MEQIEHLPLLGPWRRLVGLRNCLATWRTCQPFSLRIRIARRPTSVADLLHRLQRWLLACCLKRGGRLTRIRSSCSDLRHRPGQPQAGFDGRAAFGGRSLLGRPKRWGRELRQARRQEREEKGPSWGGLQARDGGEQAVGRRPGIDWRAVKVHTNDRWCVRATGCWTLVAKISGSCALQLVHRLDAQATPVEHHRPRC